MVDLNRGKGWRHESLGVSNESILTCHQFLDIAWYELILEVRQCSQHARSRYDGLVRHHKSMTECRLSGKCLG